MSDNVDIQQELPGFIRMVAQVKVKDFNRNKWQFEIQVNPELTDGERDQAIHSRAARKSEPRE